MYFLQNVLSIRNKKIIHILNKSFSFNNVIKYNRPAIFLQENRQPQQNNIFTNYNQRILFINKVYINKILIKEYCSNVKKENLHNLNHNQHHHHHHNHHHHPHHEETTIKSSELLQNVLEKQKNILIEKKNLLVNDIRNTKAKVQEKVREKVEDITERENILTIPNLLCVGRAFLAPYLGYVIIQGDYTIGMCLLIAAGISDILDGYIARNWPTQASKAGSFLDPMADKLLVGSLVISLSYCNLLPIWLMIMILFRDVFLIGAGFVIRYISLPPPKTLSRYFDATHVTAQLAPTFISKVNTFVQLGTVAISLGAPIWSYIDHQNLHYLWYLTGITTIAAALSYILTKDTYKIFNKNK